MGLTGEDKKKYQRDYMKTKRSNKTTGLTEKGLTDDGSNTIKTSGSNILLKRPNGADYNPDETMPGGTKRYVGPFSDGQVLDRLAIPLIDRGTIPYHRLQELRAVVSAEFKPCKGRDIKRLQVELNRHMPVSKV